MIKENIIYHTPFTPILNKRDSTKTDAKFYAIHGSLSEYELRTMSNTRREQDETMKRYI